MKIKSFVVAGLVVASVSPVMAGDLDDFKVTVDKNNGNIIIDPDSAKMIDALKKYEAAQKMSEEIKAQRQKCLSAGNFWIDGNCISKNPCTSSKASDQKYCVKAFKDVQVATEVRAANIMKTYVVNVLKWEGCAEMRVPKSAAFGQDYIYCKGPDGDFRMFEFDDMSESVNVLADNNYAYGMCIALKGKMTFPKKDARTVTCTGISKANCENKLNGAFESNKCKVVM